MSTGAKESNQTSPTNQGGGNLTGKEPAPIVAKKPANFLDSAGRGDNQSTSRGKGTN